MAEVYESQNIIRLSLFFLVLSVLFILEKTFPKRLQVGVDSLHRRFTNVALLILDTLLLRYLLPFLAMGAAIIAERNQWGVLQLLALPAFIDVFFAVCLLDLSIFFQHVLFHKIPFFWSFHQVHHADRMLDVTTGVRFHPIEILLSMGIKIGLILLLGAPVMAVFLFEVILSLGSLFSHSNIRIPHTVDRKLQTVLVTPDMHRLHHSTDYKEMNSNFGFSTSLWDRLFGFYTSKSCEELNRTQIGLPAHQNEKPSHFLWCLKMPFIHAHRRNR